MKTKEEILKEEHSKIITNSDKIFRERPSLVFAAHNAMEVFAKQQAIAFSQWLFKEGWVDFDGVDSWYNTAKKRAGLKTTEELHAQFIESLNK